MTFLTASLTVSSMEQAPLFVDPTIAATTNHEMQVLAKFCKMAPGGVFSDLELCCEESHIDISNLEAVGQLGRQGLGV